MVTANGDEDRDECEDIINAAQQRRNHAPMKLQRCSASL